MLRKEGGAGGGAVARTWSREGLKEQHLEPKPASWWEVLGNGEFKHTLHMSLSLLSPSYVVYPPRILLTNRIILFLTLPQQLLGSHSLCHQL